MPKRLPAITIVRAYEIGPQKSAYRILVDRLWPRGLKKEYLQLDEWAKDLAPSAKLRTWFGHRPERWEEFRKRYLNELRSNDASVDKLLTLAAHRRVELLFGARDLTHNHELVLLEYLKAKRRSSIDSDILE